MSRKQEELSKLVGGVVGNGRMTTGLSLRVQMERAGPEITPVTSFVPHMTKGTGCASCEYGELTAESCFTFRE
jgi:hypothetical protein